MLSIGQKVTSNGTTVKSISGWNIFRKAFPSLICPCKLKFDTELEVLEDLMKGYYLLRYTQFKGRLTILHESECRRIVDETGQ